MPSLNYATKFSLLLCTLLASFLTAGCASTTTVVIPQKPVIEDVYQCEAPVPLKTNTMGAVLGVAIENKTRLLDCKAKLESLKRTVSPVVTFAK